MEYKNQSMTELKICFKKEMGEKKETCGLCALVRLLAMHVQAEQAVCGKTHLRSISQALHASIIDELIDDKNIPLRKSLTSCH